MSFFYSFKVLCFFELLILVYQIDLKNNNSNEEQEIIFVYEHCRNGKRSPLKRSKKFLNTKIKFDAYNIQWDNIGELTKYGKIQHYFLGLRNKFRYRNFIDFSKYDRKEIFTYSSGINRAKESLYYQLIGMFSDDFRLPYKKVSTYKISNKSFSYYFPPNIKIWEKREDFLPFYNEIYRLTNKNKKISIKELDKKTFDMEEISNEYISILSECKNHRKYIKLLRSQSYKDKIKEFVKLYSNDLQKGINFTNDSFFYEKEVSKDLADHFISDYEDGEKRKEIIDFCNKNNISLSSFYKSCKDLYFFHLYNIRCYSKTCILGASRLMKNLLLFMDNAIKNNGKNSNSPKMIIDVGHDTTINNIQILMKEAFGVKYNYCIFGCNLYFEIYKIKKNNSKKRKYILRYLENEELLVEVNFNEFKKKVLDLIWTNEEINNFCNGDLKNIFKIRENNEKVNIISKKESNFEEDL